MTDHVVPSGHHAASPPADERFLLLLDTLPHPAFIIAGDGQAVLYNRAFLDYLGFHPGPTRAGRTALHHPDDQPLLEAARAAGVAADREYVVEIRLRRHDGCYRWHRIHNKPVFRDGHRTAYLGTAVDVHQSHLATEDLERRVCDRTSELEDANRRLSAGERRYRDLYNLTPMALQSSDSNACLIDVNDTWLDMFGYTRDAVIGRSPSAFMTPASAEVYRTRAWPEMLASRGAVRVVDYEFVTATGRVFDGRLTARGMFDASGHLSRTWAAIADVTAEKQAGRALQQAQRLDAIGQLTTGIAHDFNNLLTAILGNLELAARPGQDEPRRQRLIAGARTAAQRGAKLTSQLLAFSRQQRILAEPLDVSRVMEGLQPLLTAAVGAAFHVAITAEPGLPPALADATQLELAVLNLVINARDAMGTGGHIRITAERRTIGPPARPEEPEQGEYVMVEVRDDGPGIPDAVRDRIFEPFFTTKGAGRGSGLGLAQVLGILKQMGGGVRVEASPGQGTAIALFLPLAGTSLDGLPATQHQAAALPYRPCRILLVDDDDDVRAMIGGMLAEAGHTVIEAASGHAAIDALKQASGAFDLLLADVAMPGMNGAELVTQLRQAWPGLPALLMTGYAANTILPKEFQGQILRKPFQAAELDAKVAAAVAPPVR